MPGVRQRVYARVQQSGVLLRLALGNREKSEGEQMGEGNTYYQP